MGAELERVTAQFVCINVPPTSNLQAVRGYLVAQESAGILEYETCEERVAGSFDDKPSGPESGQRPNPSIERTSQRPLCALWLAARVERRHEETIPIRLKGATPQTLRALLFRSLMRASSSIKVSTWTNTRVPIRESSQNRSP
jgi:hypothetical protein